MFDLPQTILNQLLTMRNTAPDRLSPEETAIAVRICHCEHCLSFWVRRKAQRPDRCPKCHKTGWDRPFINALLAGLTNTPKPPPHASKKEPTNGGPQ